LASIINSTDTGSGGLITTGDSSDELQLQTAETTAITITSGQQSAFIAGTAAAPAVTTTGDLNTGIYFPAADNIGFTTGGTIRGRWTTDGLCFGTDTAAADALDDYEEGTWTPTVSSGYTSISYNNQHGWYVKVGLLAVISCRVQFSGTANAGNIIIAGLPFTQGTLGGGAYGGGGIPYATVAAITGTSPYVGDNTVQFFTTGTGTQITSGATNVTSQWISFVVSISVA
jgi:hypothetical protein